MLQGIRTLPWLTAYRWQNSSFIRCRLTWLQVITNLPSPLSEARFRSCIIAKKKSDIEIFLISNVKLRHRARHFSRSFAATVGPERFPAQRQLQRPAEGPWLGDSAMAKQLRSLDICRDPKLNPFGNSFTGLLLLKMNFWRQVTSIKNCCCQDDVFWCSLSCLFRKWYSYILISWAPSHFAFWSSWGAYSQA